MNSSVTLTSAARANLTAHSAEISRELRGPAGCAEEHAPLW